MNEKRILVIDDSATIRKLVDTHLGTAGYDVTLAPNAEDGLRLAQEIRPDLILLDHQLPGTTGFEVCQQLIQIPELKQTPVVVSSTLRKKAYVEYADLDIVVDMLPKPYTEDLLITTVANAIETAEMVLASQSIGSAVPEIIGDSSDADIRGTFNVFQLREVLDMLNNGTKKGILELEAEKLRLWIYLDRGRLQGISASGISATEIDAMIERMPESLTNLAEVLKLTVAGRGTAEFDSFMQLLDRRVLDPRLTSRLLRFQAAQLMGIAMQRELISFEFRACSQLPGIHESLPLDVSVLALLVEYSMHCPEAELLPEGSGDVFARRNVRGQNLDRAGLSARHMKVLNLLSEPVSIDELAARVDWPRDEARRVLNGLVQAGVLERSNESNTSKFVVYEPSTVIAGQLRAALKQNTGEYLGKVVRDPLTLQLLVKRASPKAVFFALDTPSSCAPIKEMIEQDQNVYADVTRILLVPESALEDSTINWQESLGFEPDQILRSPYTTDSLFSALEQVNRSEQSQETGEPNPSAVVGLPQGIESLISEEVSQ